MKRRSTNRKKDGKKFSRSATYTHKRNKKKSAATNMRGGHRI